MYKLVAFDMDGTVLNSKKELTEFSYGVLKKLSDMGVILVAASGRGKLNLAPYFNGFKIAYVTDNGSMAYDMDEKLLFCDSVPQDMFYEAIDFTRSTGYMEPVLFAVDASFCQDDCAKHHREFLNYFFKGVINFVPDLKEVFNHTKVGKLAVNTGGDGSNVKRGLEDLSAHYGDTYSYMCSGEGWIDLMKHGVSKGSGLTHMCEMFGIDKKDVAVFGDFLNDMPMFECFENSYAVANAHRDIKAIAKYITEFDNDNDGVARELIKIYNL